MTSPQTPPQTPPPIPPRTNPPETRYHYRTIARAIAAIDAAGGVPLSLPDLAARMNMSPAHFQRVFSQWVGVSPKRYQQYLTLGQAREMLAHSRSTLATAADLGLSGQGRLHDLFVRWEAMSPGDYAQRGAGLTIRTATCDTPFGPAVAMATDKGLCGLGFAGELGERAAYDDLAQRWPNADFVPDGDGAVAAMVTEAFNGRGAKLHLIGAPFQIKVWEALLHIPGGHVSTYSTIAEAVCTARASRAVGTAVGRNPISYLIPCHRVLRKDGALGGYHWGLPVKRALLAWEGARHDAGAGGAPDVASAGPLFAQG